MAGLLRALAFRICQAASTIPPTLGRAASEQGRGRTNERRKIVDDTIIFSETDGCSMPQGCRMGAL